MNYKKLLTILLVIVLVGTVLIISFGLKGKRQVNYKIESLPDGEGLVVYSFNKNNQKTLELKCKESMEQSGGRTILKGIDGLIYKKGRMNKDIHVSGDEGYVENDSNDFFVQNNARLVAQNLSLSSDSFKLKDQAEMSSAPNVSYQTDALKGMATGGMGLYLNINTLKFYNTVGTYLRDKKTFNFKTSVMWVIEKDQLLVMEKDTMVRDKESYLRSDWLSMKFTKDMKHIMETASQKNSYLFVDDQEKKDSKEIKGEVIKSSYDADGHLTQILAMQNVSVLLKNKNHRMSIASPKVEMNYDGRTGRPKNLKILMRGIIEHSGKTQFSVTGDTIYFEYNAKGEPKSCDGSGKVGFRVEKYNGITQKFTYNIEKNTMTLSGENSELLNGKNTFRSNTFTVDTKNKILTTSSGSRSIMQFEGKNVLFSKDPVFINAQKFTILEKENKSVYEKDVRLNQGNTVLLANSLEVGKDNTITASGAASLSFKDKENGKIINIKGDKIIFKSKEKCIDISGNAIIKSDETILRATGILIRFNDKNEIERIIGEKKVIFNKDELSGYSEKVDWFFKEETMVFTGSPYIIKKSKGTDSGKTIGKELKINLKTDKITILSDDSSRTETIINK
ncbi:MAG: LptA/OstA family protein [Candidatus Omnitrophota bacterium]